MSTKVRYCVGNVGHPRAAQYALRTLLEMVVPPSCLVLGSGVDAQREDEAVVTYGMVREGMESGVRVFDSGFFDHHYGSIDAMPKRPLVRIQNTPAIYRDDRDATDRFYSFQHGAQGVTVDCHVDIVAGAFFLLSRYEETIVRTTDTFGRFPAESSVAYQEGFLQEPVVNQYAERLLTMLRIAGFTGERRSWWRGAPWAIALTHDVDQQYRFPHGRPPALAVARSLAGRASADAPRWDRLLADYAATATHRKKDEYDCLAEMAAWEVSVGIRASYYFLGDSSGRRGADYATDAPGVTLQMKTVASMGHEIGFHAGFWASDDTQRFRTELTKVRSAGLPVVGGRQHYLRWKTPVTWRLWEAEGLAYDASLGFSKAAGFRCGTCLPFHPFDIESDREMSILEWPLMFMDATYVSSWSEGTRLLDDLSQKCQRYGGVLVLLWHNRNWSSVYAPAIRECFRSLLERCIAQGVAVSSIVGLAQLADATLSSQGAVLGERVESSSTVSVPGERHGKA
jgi:hypothetical protein